MELSRALKILSKVEMISDNYFDSILALTKLKGVEAKKKENEYIMIFLTEIKEFIEDLKDRVTYVDCRLFAFLLSSFIYDTRNFIMPLVENIVDVMVPPNCYYMTLNESMGSFKNHNLTMGLGNSKGQWLVNVELNNFRNPLLIGFSENGIEQKRANDWIADYQKKIIEIIDTTDLHQLDTIKLSILQTLIKKNDNYIPINIFKFNAVGESQTIFSSKKEESNICNAN